MGFARDFFSSDGLTVLPRRLLARLIAIAVVAFAVLMLAGPWLFYPPVYRATGQTLFSSFGGDRIVRFEPVPGGGGLHDTRIEIGLRAGGRDEIASGMPVNSVREGYVPIAVVVALCAGLFFVRRPRLSPVLIAIAATEGFVILRLWVALVYGFSRVGVGDHYLLELSAPLRPVVSLANAILGTDLHGTYVVPILIWAMTCLRASNLPADGQVDPAPGLARSESSPATPATETPKERLRRV
jgi:hypothetical protein